MSSPDKKSFAAGVKAALKKKGLLLALAGAVAGALLIAVPGTKTESAAPENARPSAEEYCAMLQQKAENLITGLDGVKKCKVVVTLSEGYTYIYASDQHVSEESASDKYSKKTDKNVVFSASGNDKSPPVVCESMPKVAGVAVVCPGADYNTKYRVIELLSALFDVKSNRISVQS